MAVYKKKLHIKKNDGKQQDITLYTTTGEVGSPYLGLKDGNTTVYAKLVATNGANPSQLYVKKGNTTYRVATTAAPPAPSATTINSGQSFNVYHTSATGAYGAPLEQYIANYMCVTAIGVNTKTEGVQIQFSNSSPYSGKSFTGTVKFTITTRSNTYTQQCSFSNKYMNGSWVETNVTMPANWAYSYGTIDSERKLTNVTINGSYK